MKTILILDGQGGGVGKSIVTALRRANLPATLLAAGTNALATAAMLKAGADVGATGENAIIYNCQRVDVIIGPIGIILANAMYGELTPDIAQAVALSPAEKVLIPITKCHAHIVGVPEGNIASFIEEAVQVVSTLL